MIDACCARECVRVCVPARWSKPSGQRTGRKRMRLKSAQAESQEDGLRMASGNVLVRARRDRCSRSLPHFCVLRRALRAVHRPRTRLRHVSLFQESRSTAIHRRLCVGMTARACPCAPQIRMPVRPLAGLSVSRALGVPFVRTKVLRRSLKRRKLVRTTRDDKRASSTKGSHWPTGSSQSSDAE